jgi:hypothetical protein
LRQRSGPGWGEPARVAEPKSRTSRKEAGRDQKWQAGNVDPGMEALRGAAVAGEGKAVRKDPVPNRARLAARREALIRRLGKTADGELTGRAHGGPGRIVHGVHAAGEQGWKSADMSDQPRPHGEGTERDRTPRSRPHGKGTARNRIQNGWPDLLSARKCQFPQDTETERSQPLKKGFRI